MVKPVYQYIFYLLLYIYPLQLRCGGYIYIIISKIYIVFINKILFFNQLHTCTMVHVQLHLDLQYYRGCHGSDRMVVGFTTIYAISAYHNWCCEFKSRSGRGVQQYVIKFVSDLRQVGGFLRVLPFPPLIKLTTTI
jgi:hypothetical protein